MRWIEWIQPAGKTVMDPVYQRVSEETAVKLQKEAYPDHSVDNQTRLADFMTIHWAWFCDPPSTGQFNGEKL